jgi:hypothetical protein
MDKLVVLQEDKRAIERHKHIKHEWMEMLQNARQSPILDIASITPASVMEGYISKQANQYTLKPLSPAGYGGKRTAVFRLIRCHNGKVHPRTFKTKRRHCGKDSQELLTPKR